jgi:hypothetical protein
MWSLTNVSRRSSTITSAAPVSRAARFAFSISSDPWPTLPVYVTTSAW